MSPASEAPAFAAIVDRVSQASPLQRKAVTRWLAQADARFWQRAETFARKLDSYLAKHALSPQYVVDSYLGLCADMLAEQKKFAKTGRYSLRRQSEALERVYDSPAVMSSYMFGVALSQFLWPNHYKLYDFHLAQLQRHKDAESYLEIGPGHGLFLVAALEALPRARFTAVDISATSLAMSQSIVSHFAPGHAVEFVQGDASATGFSRSFDLVSICEVLEHLDCPGAVLERLRGAIAEGGAMILTTCANCPAVDHVYLFDSVAHIRREVERAGLRISAELCLPVGDIAERDWESRAAEINYAALVVADTRPARTVCA